MGALSTFVEIGKQKEVRRSQIRAVRWMPDNFPLRLSQNCLCSMTGMSRNIVVLEDCLLKLSQVFCPKTLANLFKTLSWYADIIVLWPSTKSTSKMPGMSPKNCCRDLCSWVIPFSFDWTTSTFGSHCFDCVLPSGSYWESHVLSSVTILQRNPSGSWP